MNLGFIAPSFVSDWTLTTRVCDALVELGLDGVFAYDHQMNPGNPAGPSLSGIAVMSALAARYSGEASVGPLAWRCGVFSETIERDVFSTLAEISNPVAALGVGDAQALREAANYGYSLEATAARWRRLDSLARWLDSLGVKVWIAGQSVSAKQLANSADMPLNLWNADVSDLASLSSHYAVTWAGPLWDCDSIAGGVCLEDVSIAVDKLRNLQAVGASWSVIALPCVSEFPDASVEAMRQVVTGFRKWTE